MKTWQFDTILLEGFLHRPATRAHFYRDQANEHGIEHRIFIEELQLAFDSVRDLVNWKISPDSIRFHPEHECYGDPPTKAFIISEFNPEIKSNKQVHRDNIGELQEAINGYKSMVIGSFKGRQAFACDLTNDQKENLFNELVRCGFISRNTLFETFLQAFSGKETGKNDMIIWTLKNRKGGPHVTALRELLTLMIKTSPSKKNVSAWFVDPQGKPLSIPKPKHGESSNYLTTLEEIFKRI